MIKNLINYELSIEENLVNGNNLLICRVDDNLNDIKIDVESTKVLTKIEQLYDDYIENVFIDKYDESIHGVVVKNFIQYSDYFSCQERVFFEALLVKAKYFKDKFYWSIPKIREELGIKRTAAESIISRFEQEKILKKRVEKRFNKEKNRPEQIAYFEVDFEVIYGLIEKIYTTDIIDKKDYFERMYLN